MSVQELALFATKIVDYRVAPDRVTVGDLVTISGGLQEHYEPIFCWWRGWGPSTISLVVNAQTVETKDTELDGTFTFRWYPKETGTYWVKVIYGGDWAHYPCQSAEVGVTVITKEQKETEERNFWILVAGIGGAVVITVIGIVAWMEESRRREMMLIGMR